MVAIVAVVSIAVFLVAFSVLQIVAKCKSAINVAQGAVDTIKNPALTDLDREKFVQKASVTLIGLFVSILIRSSVSLVIAAVPIWTAAEFELARSEEVIGFLSRWDVILLSSLIIVIMLALWHRLKNTH
jgi:hypothetical protein